MNPTRLADYLDHMRQAATEAQSFVDGMTRAAFEADRRTQQAVIMSLVIIGEAAARATQPSLRNTRGSLGRACAGCETG